MLVSLVIFCVSLRLCSFFLHSFCPLCFFGLYTLYQPFFIFANFFFCQFNSTVEPCSDFSLLAYCIFNFRISICFFFVISFSFLIFSLWWGIIIVPSFNSLSMISFDSLKIFVIAALKSAMVNIWAPSKFLLPALKNNKQGFPGGAVVENLPANAGDTGSSPGLGRSHMPRSN